MFYRDQLRARIRISLVLLPAMFSPSALAVPLEPEAHEPYGYQHPPKFEPALQADHGGPCNLEYPSSFPPCGGQERIALPVPFLEPEPRQGPLAQEIRLDLIDEFTPTYQQLEASVYNNYWAETPLNPELSGSGAAYDQSSYHNRGGKGNVVVDPSGQRARTGWVNIHLPGEEVGDLACPESVKVKKRSLRSPLGAGYGGTESFKKRMGQGGSIPVAQLDSIDPSLGPTGEPILGGYDDLRGFAGHRGSYRRPYREPLPQGYIEEASRPVIKHPWRESREPHAHRLAGAKPRATEVTVTRTVTVTVTKRPRNPPNRTVCATLTIDVTKTITVGSELPARTVTTTHVIPPPTELPGKLSELDDRLKELGDELKYFDPGN